MTPEETQQATDLAVATAYLVTGFNDAIEEARAKKNAEKYEKLSDKHSGHTGITTELVEYARVVEHLYDKYAVQPQAVFPGVFHYEMTEHFGKWLFEMDMPRVIDFENYADVRIRLWITQ